MTPNRLATALFAALALAAPLSARAQICPWNGDEPPEFTHYVDRDGDGACDRVFGDAGELVVAEVASPGGGVVHPNGAYPDCAADGDAPQISHGHWEYTHRQTEPGAPSVTEEKDYLTLPQALVGDLLASDVALPRTLASLGQTIRFLEKEPERFEQFLGANAPPSGRYWQVDEWIGPALPAPLLGIVIPGLTWTERFFVCATAADPLGDCFERDGLPVLGAYWSDHRSLLDADCGDGTDPDDQRDPGCGLLFTAAPACPAE